MSITRWFYKRRHLASLANEAWLTDANAAYAEHHITDIQQLIAAERRHREELDVKVAALQDGPPTYRSRKDREALEQEQQLATGKIADYEKTIMNLRTRTQQLRQQAAEIRTRREFIRARVPA